MPFSFIKYVRPHWQFNVVCEGKGMLPSCIAPTEYCSELPIDSLFETIAARQADLGYRLCSTGYLLESKQEEIQKHLRLPAPTIKDEYRFIRKYWGTYWAIFVLLRRLLSFCNPIDELQGFYGSRDTKKINLFEAYNHWKHYDAFESPLISIDPFVCVVIPTLNRYGYLADVLRDLGAQTYKNFEVIVVDQSDEFKPDFYNCFDLNIRVVRQENKALWTARNKAVELTDSDYLLFFDDDSRVDPDWIFHHLKCLDFFGVDVSAGVSLAIAGGKISGSYSFFRWADQFDSGNAMVKRSLFEKTGLFDLTFDGQRMGDGEFGFRLHRSGIRSISNPKAKRLHLKAGEGGLRDIGSWDGFRLKKLFAPKPVPSVIYLYRKYLPSELYKNAIFLGLVLSNVPYRFKGNTVMIFFSVLLSFFKAPLLFIQLRVSKAKADKMQQRIPFLKEKTFDSVAR